LFIVVSTTMPPKKINPKPGPKSPPKSAFSTGKFTGGSPFGAKKDTRHQLFIEGLHNGIVVMYIKKHNVDEEPFLNHDYRLLSEDAQVKESLGVTAILSRKGVDGITTMKQSSSSTYPWRQIVCIGGEESNTAAKRGRLASLLVGHLNNNATTENYRYPKRVKFGGDVTGVTFRPLDCCLLDSDVIGAMEAAYPETTLSDLSEFEDIMATFWSDLEHGNEAMDAFQDDVGNASDTEQHE
jgi:hypothetical protein